MIHEIDPLSDARWSELLLHHPRASVFHSPGWLDAIYRTYHHKAAVLTTSAKGRDLRNGLVFCRVNSWLTGRRLVSLPFSDHCEVLTETAADLTSLTEALQQVARAEGRDYVEVRPLSSVPSLPTEWRPSRGFSVHRLDLRPGATEVFRRFHRSCVQRRIAHAGKEGVSITEGRDLKTLKVFYQLVVETRRRQGLPAQPGAWFRNLLECLGESATIRCAWLGPEPLAAILTLQYGKSLYYKYGASQARFHRLGAVPYLFWQAIREAIAAGLEELDMGRTDFEDSGLATFKERWGAARTGLSYWRFSEGASIRVRERLQAHRVLRTISGYVPAGCRSVLGSVFYRHID
jgi:hypothetical protein